MLYTVCFRQQNATVVNISWPHDRTIGASRQIYGLGVWPQVLRVHLRPSHTGSLQIFLLGFYNVFFQFMSKIISHNVICTHSHTPNILNLATYLEIHVFHMVCNLQYVVEQNVQVLSSYVYHSFTHKLKTTVIKPHRELLREPAVN